VEKEYSFETKDGQKTLAELFDARLFSLVLDASRFTSEPARQHPARRRRRPSRARGDLVV
jgi:predicted dithiol-disulfide oxidoreductase (DUF899 family)